MTKNRFILTSLLVLFGVQTPQLAQESSTPSINAEHARHALGISILRAINTAEVTHKIKNGAYVPWQTLLSSQPSYFNLCLRPGLQWWKDTGRHPMYGSCLVCQKDLRG